MTPPTPDLIMQHLLGYLSSQYLCVANDAGLFPALRDGPQTLDQLATRLSMPRRMVRILADALVAVGFLVREGDHYRNGIETATFLAGAPGPDLRPALRMWHRFLPKRWSRLDEGLRTGRSLHGFADFTSEDQALFSDGVGAFTAGAALALARSYDFTRHQALLDLGGGTGSFLTAIRERAPHLRAALVELPSAIETIRQRLAATPGGDAIELIPGDVFVGDLPRGYDAVLLANVVHIFSPEHNCQLLSRIHGTVAPGARLLLVDFWTNQTHTEPAYAALMAAEFQMVSGEGDVYSLEEIQAWLDATRWRFVEHRPLIGPASLVVAEAG
ncbi:MAG TPA: methyltransferase [Polyangia bacterium]|nr:methyltransferase [Polyangia bacterium]